MMTLELHALGMLEYTSIAKGIASADQMVKTAAVTPLFFKTICPGKYLAAIHGNVAAVTASIEAGREIGGTEVVDGFVLANVHSQILWALTGAAPQEDFNALGVLETFSAASIVLAADAAAKAAGVTILDIHLAMGLGGKGYAYMTGDVAAVQAAVEAGEAVVAQSGLLVASVVIPRPAPQVWNHILGAGVGA